MRKERLLKILRAPHISEKSARGSEKNRQYAFKVLCDANKKEIKAAVEQLFNVTVESVRVCNMKAKETRTGRIMGSHNAWKKAYVTLAEGSELEIAEGQA